jgi:hypothetical protein
LADKATDAVDNETDKAIKVIAANNAIKADKAVKADEVNKAD